MKFHRSYVAFAFVLAPLAGMAFVTACGGDNGVGDAGPDATTNDVVVDVAPEATKSDASDASCANDVDLTSYLPSADAAVDVDAGGLNVSACTGCLKTNCGSDINACNQDCVCRQDIVDVVTCVAQGGTFQSCALSALGNQGVQNLFTCALGSCQAACIPSDAGVKDGSSDAPTDAPDGG